MNTLTIWGLRLAAIASITSTLPLANVYAQEQKPATATIHVYRPKSHLIGIALITPAIYLDGTELQPLHNGAFFVTTVPVGKHMIICSRSTEGGLLLDFEPGRDYYFRFNAKNFHGGWVQGNIFLSQVSFEEAEREMKKLREQTVPSPQ
jgi:hypothetical protein